MKSTKTLEELSLVAVAAVKVVLAVVVAVVAVVVAVEIGLEPGFDLMPG